MLRDNYTSYEAARFYSISSAIYVPAFVLGLVLTDAYLLAGHNSYVPVFGVFSVAEIIKYMYIQLLFHKDSSYNTKQGFKLFNIIFYFAKQIKFIELFRSVVVLCGFTGCVFLVAILFGAEMFDKHEQTVMFSGLVMVLTVFPMCLHFGPITVMHYINGIYASDVFTKVLLRNIHFTVLGAWFGAFVIPLDWDSAWQEWPISCSLGAMVGFSVSHIYSLVDIFSKYNDASGKLFFKYTNKVR